MAISDTTYDVIIVGGRCAGASLAAFAARQGLSVALLEGAEIGSDQVLSTHTVHPAGVDILAELGIADAVLAESPPAKRIRIEFDGKAVDVEPPAGRSECCPRRYRLDRLLQDAAVASGADFRPRTKVIELLRDGERVTGVVAQTPDGPVELHARVTVGADGRHSTIARLVEAEEYLGYDAVRGMYWAYWNPPAGWAERVPFDFLVKYAGPHRRLLFPTDGGQLLLATMPPMEAARTWRGDAERHYTDDMKSDATFRPIVEGGERTSQVIGTISERFFFRQSAGPGWALVGDAGHHKDPVLGWGISEALHQSKHLAAAIAEGTDAALQRYWRQRDVDALPRFRLAEDRGALGSINPVFPVVAERIMRSPALIESVFRETEFDSNPYELLPVSAVARSVLGAAVKGRPGLLRHFVAQGRRISAVNKELSQAKARLAEVPAAAEERVAVTV